MPPMNGSFDATQHAPKQMGSAHPVGVYDASISNTTIATTKDQSGGMFVVTFTSSAGSIDMRYNLWNQSDKAKEIANGQLSALCHATGIFRLDWGNEGAALRGGRCKIEVGPQANDDKYNEVKKVMDPNGNEPGKAPANVPQQGSTGAPQAQAWGAGGSAPVEAQQPMQQAPGGWGPPQGQQAQPPQQQPGFNQQPQGNAPQGWQPAPNAQQPQQGQQPQNNAGGAPPWGPQ